MMETESAQIAYEAYCNEVGWVSPVTGDSLPSWHELPYSVQNGWHSVAEALEEWIILRERGR